MIRFLLNYYKFILVISAFIFHTVNAYCQQTFCNPDQTLETSFNTVRFLQKYKQHVSDLKNNKRTADTTNYVVPVVFRVVHDRGTPIGQDENLSDAELIQSLEWLNERFSGQNCPGENPGIDINISFCLARRDINGNTTSGITRHTSNLTDMRAVCDLEAMTNVTETGGTPIANPFSYTDYISIWVVRSICPDQIPLCDIAGLAMYEGIVLESETLKNCKGIKIAVHEMGHYFSLIHPFDNGCANNDCLVDGDGVCDTPPVDDFSIDSYNCAAGNPGTKNSCTSDVNASDPNNPFTTDQPDLQNNYMDYSPDDCRITFTEGQRTKMRFNLTNGRPTLLVSRGCTDTTSTSVIINDTNYIFIPPPVCSDVTSSTLMRGPNNACQGDTFEYRTYYSCTIANEWKVLGPSKILSSTNKKIKVYFANPGIDTIIINVQNDCGKFTDTIFVTTEKIPDLSFINTEYLLCPGEAVSFYAKADSAIVYVVNNASGTVYYPIKDSIYLPPHYSDSCYTVNAKYSQGNCTAKKTICVKMLCSEELFVPTAFTPNGDGINDILKPLYNGNPGALKLISFRIYNRWSELLYTTKVLNTGWDGKVNGKRQPMGTIVWVLEYLNHKGAKVKKKGSSVLIR